MSFSCEKKFSGHGINSISQEHWAQRQGRETRWVMVQSMSIASPLNIMYLGCDSKLKNPELTYMDMRRKCSTLHREQPELKIEQWIVKLGDLVKLFCQSGLLSGCSQYI